MSALSALYGTYTVIKGKACVTLPIPSPLPSEEQNSKPLSDRTIIVTGANTGLGYESCLHLARLGVGRIIMAVRTVSKGDSAKAGILAAYPSRDPGSIDVWQVDMDSYTSVRAFAERAAEQTDRVDGVLANAGIMTTKFEYSSSAIPPPPSPSGQAVLSLKHDGTDKADKVEKTIQVNVLSTFYLYLLLLPTMRASAAKTGVKCRFVIPNSALHYMAPTGELVAGLADADVTITSKTNGETTTTTRPRTAVILDRLNDPEKADMQGRYPLSKLLVLYAVREFSARQQQHQQASPSASSPESKGNKPGVGGVILNTPNPSFCRSGLAHESADSKGFQMFERLMARTGEEGSRVLVHGLLAGEETDGAYLSNCEVETPARHVTSKWGQKVQKRIVDEMLIKLERVHPGISSNI